MPSTQRVMSVAELRPSNEGKVRTLQIDPSQVINILVHGGNGSTERRGVGGGALSG